MSDIRGRSHIIRKERADSVRPILRWIKKSSSRKKVRDESASILRKLEGINDWKQVILTRGEEELLSFVYNEWPEGSMTDQQLKLL